MASSVDWYYHRPNCMTCAKSQAFLNRRKIGVKEMVNAAKLRFQPDEALKLGNKVLVICFDQLPADMNDENLPAVFFI